MSACCDHAVVPSWRAMCTVRATSSSITAALTARRRGADHEEAVVRHEHGAGAMVPQRLDDPPADRVVADQRERADRDFATDAQFSR